MTAGEELDAIMDDLDRTTAAWAAAGHRYDTPEHEAREAVFLRLRDWNARQAAPATLPPLTKEEAVREVAWIARRARELALVDARHQAPPAEYAEFFARKIRLLQHIGTPEALALVPANEELLRSYRGASS